VSLSGLLCKLYSKTYVQPWSGIVVFGNIPDVNANIVGLNNWFCKLAVVHFVLLTESLTVPRRNRLRDGEDLGKDI
jgi:hypothetical protein